MVQKQRAATETSLMTGDRRDDWLGEREEMNNVRFDWPLTPEEADGPDAACRAARLHFRIKPGN